MGTLGGVRQGAAGISAPISITFLNSIRLDRSQFIATISLFFFVVGFIQLPIQVWYGIMNWELFIQSCVAVLPLTVFMPVGAMIGKRLSPIVFDRVRRQNISDRVVSDLRESLAHRVSDSSHLLLIV